jgi:hypothetical protein
MLVSEASLTLSFIPQGTGLVSVAQQNHIVPIALCAQDAAIRNGDTRTMQKLDSVQKF